MADTEATTKPKEKQYHVKTMIVVFTLILGFGIFQSFQNNGPHEEPKPVETVQETGPEIFKGSYPTPAAGSKTASGETVEESQKNYLSYANQQLVAGETDESLLSTGYALCGFYQESKARAEVFAKIDEASKDDAGKLNRLITLSSYVPRTICPEFAAMK
jgi:hypothetical protein